VIFAAARIWHVQKMDDSDTGMVKERNTGKGKCGGKEENGGERIWHTEKRNGI
jgi:hypothetical protein